MKQWKLFIACGITLLPFLSLSQSDYLHFDRFDTASGLPLSFINCIEEDLQGNLWVGTQNGLYTWRENEFIPYLNNANDTNSLSNNTVYCIEEDETGFLWIGTENGVNKFNPKTGKSVRMLHSNNPSAENHISTLAVEGGRIVWIGTEGNGLYTYYRQSGKLHHYTHNPADTQSLSCNRISAIYIDKRGHIWIGTRGGGLNLFNPGSKSFSSFKPGLNDSCSISGDVINTVFMDAHNRLWAGTETGLSCMLNTTTGFCNHYLHKTDADGSISSSAVLSIEQDAYGHLWFGTDGGGLNRLVLKYANQLEPHHFVAIKMDNENPNSLVGNVVICLYKDHKGLLWIGTNKGLNRFNSKYQAVQEVSAFFKNIAKEFNKALFPTSTIEKKSDTVKLAGICNYSESYPASAVRVLLLSNENKPLDSAVTNSQGIFEFNKIIPEKEYMFKIEAGNARLSSRAFVIITNANGEPIEKIAHAGNGYFNFKALSPEEYAAMPTIETGQNELLSISLTGQIYKKLPGDFSDSVEVMIVNDAGQTLYVTRTDRKGKFVFRHLPPDANYLFVMKEAHDDAILIITDKNENIIQKIYSDENKVFRYERLPMSDVDLIHLKNVDDIKLTIHPEDRFVINKIYYDYNDYSLNESSVKELDLLIQLLNKNPDLGVSIYSHTDCRGNDAYNLELSEKRADACVQYLLSKGIHPERIKSHGLGESQAVNKCKNGVQCSEEEHAKNRRTEFGFFTNN